MQEYYRTEYGAPSTYIPYSGAVGDAPDDGALARYNVEPGGYYLAVARMEPENNVDHIIREYRASGLAKPLIVVGSVPYESEYARAVVGEHNPREGYACLRAYAQPITRPANFVAIHNLAERKTIVGFAVVGQLRQFLGGEPVRREQPVRLVDRARGGGRFLADAGRCLLAEEGAVDVMLGATLADTGKASQVIGFGFGEIGRRE